jgi:hypothetical protein
MFEFLLRDTAFMGKIDNAICLFIEENLQCELAYIYEFTHLYNTCISLVILQLPFAKK